VKFVFYSLIVVCLSCGLRVSPVAAQQLPDILGIRLGTTPREAFAVIQASHPKEKVTIHSYAFPEIPQPVIHGFSLHVPPLGAAHEIVIADATLPPSKQIVWRAQRFWRQQMNRTNLFRSLREKYGKETLALVGNEPAKDERTVHALLWLFDGQGRPATLPIQPTDTLKFQQFLGCVQAYLNFPNGGQWDINGGSSELDPANLGGFLDRQKQLGGCEYVVVYASVQGDVETGIIPVASVYIADIPIALRAAKAEAAYLTNLANRQQQQEIDKSKQAKPKL
jgi:hypothetical protein